MSDVVIDSYSMMMLHEQIRAAIEFGLDALNFLENGKNLELLFRDDTAVSGTLVSHSGKWVLLQINERKRYWYNTDTLYGMRYCDTAIDATEEAQHG